MSFEDEEIDDFDHEEGFDDNENPFANDGLFEWRQEHRRRANHEDRGIIMVIIIGMTRIALLVSS